MGKTYTVCENCLSINAINLEKAAASGGARCGSCKNAISLESAVTSLTDKSFFHLINKSPLPVVVDFWAPWCGPCKMFAPVFKEASKEYLGKVVFAKLNTEDFQQAAAANQIRGIPTLIWFKDGKESVRQSGAMPLPMFKQWLDNLLK